MALAGSDFAEIDRILRKEANIDHYINEGLSPSEIVAKHPELKEQVDERYAEGKYHATTHYEYFRQLATKNLAEAWQKFGGRTLAAWGKADFISAEEDHALIARIINQRAQGTGCSSHSTESITGSITPYRRKIVSRTSGSPTASTTRFSLTPCKIGRRRSFVSSKRAVSGAAISVKAIDRPWPSRQYRSGSARDRPWIMLTTFRPTPEDGWSVRWPIGPCE